MIAKSRDGFTLVEILIYLSILTVLASLMMRGANVYLNKTKQVRLIATLMSLQKACDRFHLASNAYPSREGFKGDFFGLPMDFFALDGEGKPFAGAYIQFPPSLKAKDYGLNVEDGDELFFGVTNTGLVFATQEPPTGVSAQ